MNTIETRRDWRAHWTTVGQRTSSDALFQQVERTIGGVPEPQDQIELLTRSISRRLSLGPNDILLDLCCGNGLITCRLSAFCRAVIGADYSLDLIEVARDRHTPPNTVYLHRAADDLQATDFPVGPPNKVCMNAGLQYFTESLTERLLKSLRTLGTHDLMLFFTDVPDVGKLNAFYNTPERWAEFERRRAAGTEAMGTWWDRDDLKSAFETAGFAAEIIDLEGERVWAHYRFDVRAQLIR